MERYYCPNCGNMLSEGKHIVDNGVLAIYKYCVKCDLFFDWHGPEEEKEPVREMHKMITQNEWTPVGS